MNGSKTDKTQNHNGNSPQLIDQTTCAWSFLCAMMMHLIYFFIKQTMELFAICEVCEQDKPTMSRARVHPTIHRDDWDFRTILLFSAMRKRIAFVSASAWLELLSHGPVAFIKTLFEDAIIINRVPILK